MGLRCIIQVKKVYNGFNHFIHNNLYFAKMVMFGPFDEIFARIPKLPHLNSLFLSYSKCCQLMKLSLGLCGKN